ncbi:MAG: di-trans,poly-cis-decaprenylcistransferase [Bacilli bacterium]|nr:di-trans,poly-cis-decaprenylcistransferase [Bacilli bacterium]
MNDRKIPNHVAIIMDGNRRWATEKGKSPSMGHLQGSKTLEKTGMYIFSTGVKYLSVFAFSTENFKRSEEEVTYLMDLLIKGFKSTCEKFVKNGIKVVISGRKTNLREDILKAVEDIEEKTKDGTVGTLNICFNYGGQAEIEDACRKVATLYKDGKIDLDNFDFNNYLYHDLPPIDLMIRTSGENRISNFMLYQLAYSELYFTNTYFPDFTEKEYDLAIDEYNKRKRRFGG